MKRWLEINTETGVAFHAPNPATSFQDSPPPTEVIFCDCAGLGVICHHVYGGDRHLTITGSVIEEQHQDDFKKAHRGPHCAHRRQIFVDVTDRPDAKLGMHYDEKTDTFSVKV